MKKEATSDADVILLTADVNMRIAARERGIEAEERGMKKMFLATQKGRNGNTNSVIHHNIEKKLLIILILFVAFIILTWTW